VRSDPWMTARLLRRTRLTSSSLLVRVKPDEASPAVSAGQTVNVSLQSPREQRRVSSFTVFTTHPDGELSLLIRSTGGGGVSDGLMSAVELGGRIWVSESIPTTILP